jgi:hypothetical protein
MGRVDQEPPDETRRAMEAAIRPALASGYDHARQWISGAIVAFALGSAGIMVAAIVSALDVIAVIACAVLCIVALAFVTGARRLMLKERSQRRWSQVAALRERQDRLRAEDALDVAALFLAGDRAARSELSKMRAPDLSVAVRTLSNEYSTAMAEARKTPGATASARQGARRAASAAPPRKVDTAAVQRRRKARQLERDALEARVQALANSSDRAAQQAAAEKYGSAKEALQADRNAWARSRRGARATQRSGGGQFELLARLDGTRDVTHKPAPPSPEEIARQSPPAELTPPEAQAS